MAYPYGYYQPNYVSKQQQPMTNKIYVTSAEDALSRFAAPNTVTVYFLQDESTIFEVATDFQCKKNIRTRKLSDVEPQKQAVSTSADTLSRAKSLTILGAN